MRKRILACVLAAAMALCLAGTVSLAEGEQTTLRILWWGSQTRHDLTMTMLDKFMEKYPNITVEPEFTDWGGYWSKLATQVAGGLTPDVIQMDHAYLVQYADNGVMASLNSYIDSGAIGVSDVDPSILASGEVGGNLFAIPTGMNALVLMYRKDILDEAGADMPFAPTWSEYIEISKQVFENTGRTDTYVVGFSMDQLRFSLRNMGLNMYNEEGTALGWDDPQFMVEGWERVLAAQEAGYGLGVGETTAATAFDDLVADSWVGCHWTNELEAYQNGSGVELEMCEVPWRNEAIQPATFFKPSMFWSISETSAVKDAAAAFINFFVNDTDCYDIVGTDRAMPISSAIREYIMPNMNSAAKKGADMLDKLSEEGHITPVMNPDVAAHGEIDALLTQYNEQVRYGLADDLTEFAKQFMDEANALIAKSLAN
jgi:multiple sugar transport system substrate-binding protein